MTEHNLPEKDDAPWLDCMDGFKIEDWVTRSEKQLSNKKPPDKPRDYLADWRSEGRGALFF